MIEPLLIIYSNSDYHDILFIATKFLSNYDNKLLLIDDKYNKKLYFDKYKEVITYKNEEPYASRLLRLGDVKDEIILFMHETDVLIKYDIDILNNLKKYIIDNNFDKIELQHCAWPPLKTPTKQTFNMHNDEIIFNDFCNLYKIDNPDFFVYNVNPTLWRKKSLMNIMTKFKKYNYREIECNLVQKYVSENFNCFSLKCNKFVKCAHFTCPLFFQFIHLTHYGSFAQLKNKYYSAENKFKHINNSYLLDDDVYDIYIEKIYEPYIKNSKRNKRNNFPL